MFGIILQNHAKIVWIALFLLNFAQIQRVSCQLKLPILNPHETMCPPDHKTCPDESTHFLCEKVKVPENCSNFHIMQMTDSIKKQFTEGHNGVRNKVATNFNIANMNLIYWSRDLETVASNYLMKCQVTPDACQFVGQNNLRVNTNLHFRHLLINRWPSRVVRIWYLELGIGVETGKQFLDKHKKSKKYALNFTQMIWPRTQFLGCAFARMYSGYMLICYYYPPYNREKFDTHFTWGEACTKCPRNRPSCSRTFQALCGLDIHMDDAATLKANPFVFLLLLLCMWFIN